MLASYLVIDLRGSTRFTLNTGPKEGAAFLTEYYKIVDSITKKYQGTFCSLLGDGTGSIFEKRFHAENAVLSAALILFSLKERGFPLLGNAGIDTGQIAMFDFNSKSTSFLCPYGKAVISACNLEKMASKSNYDIFISNETYLSLSMKNFRSVFTSMGRETPKGFEDHIQIYAGNAVDILRVSQAYLNQGFQTQIQTAA